ncbi:MAG: hypothetical protein M3R02_02190 [Chloroflexota bacterium]|nr:hypothetical protein [Chloroflexota bacterium]
MNRRLTSAVLGGALAAALSFGSVGAQEATDLDFDLDKVNVSQNGAQGLVAAVVQAQDLVDVEDSTIDVAVVELNDSLNNLQALNNVLNNNDIEVDIQDVEVLSNNQDFLNILEDADIFIGDVVGVEILDGGDFLIFVD